MHDILIQPTSEPKPATADTLSALRLPKTQTSGDTVKTRDFEQIEGYQQSREQLVEQIRKNPSLFISLPANLKTDEVCLIAVRADPKNIASLPEHCRREPECLRQLMREVPASYRFLPEDLKQNRTLALEALSRDENTFPHLAASLASDETFVRRAVAVNPRCFQWLSAEQRSREDLILSAVSKHSQAVQWIPPEVLRSSVELQQKIALTSLQSREPMTLAVGKLDSSVVDAYTSMEQAYQVLGIDPSGPRGTHQLKNGVFDNSREIIRNRYSVSDEATRAELKKCLGAQYFAGTGLEARPLAVCIWPKNDSNGAFQQFPHNDPIDSLTDSYCVVYYQAGSVAEVGTCLDQATQNGVDRASLLVLGGHGSPDSLELASGTLLTSDDHECFSSRRHEFKDGAQIVVVSCSSGKEQGVSSEKLSLANTIALSIPQAFVLAPVIDTVPVLGCSPNDRQVFFADFKHGPAIYHSAVRPADKILPEDFDRGAPNPQHELYRGLWERNQNRMSLEVYSPSEFVLRDRGRAIQRISRADGWQKRAAEAACGEELTQLLFDRKYLDYPLRWDLPPNHPLRVPDSGVDAIKAEIKKILGYDDTIRIAFKEEGTSSTFTVYNRRGEPIMSLGCLMRPDGTIAETIGPRLHPENFLPKE